MRRRELIFGGLSSLLASGKVAAQQGVATVGLLFPFDAEGLGTNIPALKDGLREAGWSQNRVRFDIRWAGPDPRGQKDEALDLVRNKVDLIAAFSTPAALACKEATDSIPVVFMIGADPEQLGLVKQRSRPSGNVTGITFGSGQVITKRFQFLQAIDRAAKDVAILINSKNSVIAKSFLQEASIDQVAANLLLSNPDLIVASA